MRGRRVRLASGIGALAGVAVLVAGCAGGGTAASPVRTVTAGTTAGAGHGGATSIPSTEAPATLGPATPGGAGTNSAAPNANGSCSLGMLQVTIPDSSGQFQAAGHVTLPLVFTNIATQTCTLAGFPGVSAYNGTGGQVGHAAVRTGRGHTVVLIAGGHTAAPLTIADYGDYCSTSTATHAAGLAIIPPNLRNALRLPGEGGLICDRGAYHQILIGSVGTFQGSY